MEKNKKARIIIGITYIIIPLIHFFLLILISENIRNQIKNFAFLFINYFMLIIKVGNIFVILFFIESILFLILGLALIKSKKFYIQIFSFILLVFILINTISLVLNISSLYYFYLIPLIIIIYSLFCLFYLTTGLIRKSSFLYGKMKIFKPYFRHICEINAEIVKNKKKFPGTIYNISVAGCQIFSNRVVNVGDVIDVSFTVKNENVGSKCRVIRKMPKIKSYINGFAVKFTKFDKSGKKTFIEFLKNDLNIQLEKSIKKKEKQK